jgi:hypothetical protein
MAAANEAGRTQRALNHDTNCKRCHLDLGPHHANREYHPACAKAREAEMRQAARALNVEKENEPQRTRYAEQRASIPLLAVKCFYREKGVHKFKTRDRRLHYCCDEHRDLGERLLVQACDRKEYWANRDKHLAKNRAAHQLLVTQAKKYKKFISSGGRRKLAPEETSRFQVGQEVGNLLPRAASALQAIASLSSRERKNFEELKAILLPLCFTLREIELVQISKARPETIARHWVADSRHMEYDSVARSHTEYKKDRDNRHNAGSQPAA